MNANTFRALIKNDINEQPNIPASKEMDRLDNISLKSCPVKVSNSGKATTPKPNVSGLLTRIPRLTLTSIVSLSNTDHSPKTSNANIRRVPLKAVGYKTKASEPKTMRKHQRHKKYHLETYTVNSSSSSSNDIRLSKPSKCKSKFCGQPCGATSARKQNVKHIKIVQSTPAIPEQDSQSPKLSQDSAVPSQNDEQKSRVSAYAHSSETTSTNRKASFTVINPKVIKISKSVNDASTTSNRCSKNILDVQAGSLPLKSAKESIVAVDHAPNVKFKANKITKKPRRKQYRKTMPIRKQPVSDDSDGPINETNGPHQRENLSEKEHLDYQSDKTDPADQTFKSKSEEFVPLDQYSTYTDEERESRQSESKHVEEARNVEPSSRSRKKLPIRDDRSKTPPSRRDTLDHRRMSHQGGDTASKMVEASVCVESSTTQTSNGATVSTSTSHHSQYSQTAETQTVRQTFRNAETSVSVPVPVQPVISSHSNSGDGPSIIPRLPPPMLPQEIPSSEPPSPTPSATAVLTQTSHTNLADDDFSLAINDAMSGSGAIITTAVPLASPSESLSTFTGFNPASTTCESPDIQGEEQAESSSPDVKKATKKRQGKKKQKVRKAKRNYSEASPPVVKSVKSRGVQVSIKKTQRIVSAVSLPSKPVTSAKAALRRSRSRPRRSSAKPRRVVASRSRMSTASSPARTSHAWKERDSSSDESYSQLHLREIAARTTRHNRLFNERRRTVGLSPPYNAEVATCQRLGEILSVGMLPRPPLLDVVHRKASASAKAGVAVRATRSAGAHAPRGSRRVVSSTQTERASQKEMATAISRFLQQLSADKRAIRLINSMATLAAKHNS